VGYEKAAVRSRDLIFGRSAAAASFRSEMSGMDP
jgi:hypothetical protein